MTMGEHDRIEIMDSTMEHVGLMVENMREADRREIMKLGLTPRRGLWRSYRNSFMRGTGFMNGQIAAMWGCGGVLLGGIGHPWVLTANGIGDMPPLSFAIMYRRKMRDMLKLFLKLQSWVDPEYVQCTRLMEIVGFKAVEEKPLGKNGEIFRSYEMNGADYGY